MFAVKTAAGVFTLAFQLMPVTGYAISIQRSAGPIDPLQISFEEVVEVRGQNNRALFSDQVDLARAAGIRAACQDDEYQRLNDVSFKGGAVVLQITCLVPEG